MLTTTTNYTCVHVVRLEARLATTCLHLFTLNTISVILVEAERNFDTRKIIPGWGLRDLCWGEWHSVTSPRSERTIYSGCYKYYASEARSYTTVGIGGFASFCLHLSTRADLKRILVYTQNRSPEHHLVLFVTEIIKLESHECLKNCCRACHDYYYHQYLHI
jgi:hypothetical protein